MTEWLLNTTLNENFKYPLRLEVQNDCSNNATLQMIDDRTLSGQLLFLALMLIKIAFIPIGIRNIRNCKMGAFRRIKIVNGVVLLYLILSASFFFDGFLKLTGLSNDGYPLPLYILLENVSIISFYTALAVGAQIWFDLLLMTKDRLGYSRQKLSRWVMISLATVQSCCLLGVLFEFIQLCRDDKHDPIVGFYAVIMSTFSSGLLFAISCGLLWVYLHHYTKEPVIHKMRIMTTIVAVATGIRVIENITNAILSGKDIPSVQMLECKGNQNVSPYTAWWIAYMALYFTITELLPTYYLLSQFSPASTHEAQQSVIYASFSMTANCNPQTSSDAPLLHTPAYTEDTETQINTKYNSRSIPGSEGSR